MINFTTRINSMRIPKKVIILFVISALLITIPLFTLPINLFQGVIEYNNGIQSWTIDAPLSLSYFIGLGYDPADMVDVVGFHLTASGWSLALIFTIGFPALISYRLGYK